MFKMGVLLCLLTPMAYAIGVVQTYKDYRQTAYEKKGQFLYRLSADHVTERLPNISSSKFIELLNLNRLQSQSVQIGSGLFETQQDTIQFARGSFNRGDLVLLDVRGELVSGRISSPEVRIRLTDLRLTARRVIRFDTSGRMIAHQRLFQTSLH